MTSEEVLQFAKKHGAKLVDFKFVDVPGIWQHFSVPMHELKEETFVEGVPFDGSSICGFQTINESDMLIIPDPTTAIMDPFTAAPTLSLVCNIAYPGPAGRKRSYTRDPRYMAGLDGIRHHIDPSDHGYGPVDRDLYHMSKEELGEIRSVPGTLSEALDALESDYSFLLEGNVFTTDMLEQYVELKRAQSDAVSLRPAPIEFALYYDA